MKKIIISIDTEGDNLWAWKYGKPITTENAKYLPRFQNLCNDFGLKPVWLTNYEMICDPFFIQFIQTVLSKKTGEIGMHLHAWNTPPEYSLNAFNQEASYLIEYPVDVMEQKIATLTKKIHDTVGVKPVSHRAGRWAMNDAYFKLLAKYGYQIDCSVTPHINWEKNVGMTKGSSGTDYSKYNECSYMLPLGEKEVLEVPMTIRKTHHLFKTDCSPFRAQIRKLYHAVVGATIWFRPNGNNTSELLYLVDYIAETNVDYIMFMIHSSELMPGGSPTFKTEESIERLYDQLSQVFQYATSRYIGVTLQEYGLLKQQELLG